MMLKNITRASSKNTRTRSPLDSAANKGIISGFKNATGIDESATIRGFLRLYTAKRMNDIVVKKLDPVSDATAHDSLYARNGLLVNLVNKIISAIISIKHKLMAQVVKKVLFVSFFCI